MLIQSQSFPSNMVQSVPLRPHLSGHDLNHRSNQHLDLRSGRDLDLSSCSTVLSLPKSWSPENQEDMLVTVYSFIRTFVGASGAGQGTIDNRIEQAMDLVKSHLMSAVRSEVEELRDKITKLEESVTLLSRENELLRANVTPEVLAGLSGQRHQLQAPPDQH